MPYIDKEGSVHVSPSDLITESGMEHVKICDKCQSTFPDTYARLRDSDMGRHTTPYEHFSNADDDIPPEQAGIMADYENMKVMPPKPSLEDDLDELERTDNHLRTTLEQRMVLIQQINEKRAIANKRLDASENFMNEVRGFDSPTIGEERPMYNGR